MVGRHLDVRAANRKMLILQRWCRPSARSFAGCGTTTRSAISGSAGTSHRTLDEDQLKRLLANETYVDIHTVKHGPGELRDQWRPLDKTAAAQFRASIEKQYASAQPLGSGNCH